MFQIYTHDYIYRALKGNTRTEANTDKPSLIFQVLIYTVSFIITLSYLCMWVLAHIPLINSLVETICIGYARGSIGFLLRGLFFKTKLKKMGTNVFIDRGTTIVDPHYVEIGSNTFIDTNVDIYGGVSEGTKVCIGDYVHIAAGCIIAGRGGIKIGDYTGIAAGSRIYSATHHYKKEGSDEFVIISPLVPHQYQHVVEAPVLIKPHVFIGFNTIVLPGAILETGCVVGAQSLVKTTVPEFVVAVGSPLKIINKRPKPENARLNFSFATKN